MRKNNARRLLSLAVACMMALSLFAGCNSQNGERTQSTVSKASSGSASEPESKPAGEESGGEATDGIVFDEQGRFVRYDPPITMTTNAIVGSDSMFHEGDDIENNGWTRWMKDTLGIEWKISWASPDEATNTQKLDLAFASDDLPDVISSASVEQITKYAKAGKMQALDGYMKDAPPLVQYYMEDCMELTQGTFWKPFTVDGSIYAMPAGTDSLDFWSDNFIRTDILKELNMEIPGTIDELEKVLEAYHTLNPNGYGIALNKDLDGIEAVLSGYGAYLSTSRQTSWVEKDGALEYSSIQPEMKQALSKLAEWYQKGYIDPEFVVKDATKVKEDVVAGNILLFNGAWHSIGGTFTPMWNAIPESETKAIPFLTGEGGKASVMKNTWWKNSRAVTVSCEHPEALFYLLGDNLDSYYRNETELRDTLLSGYNYEFKYPVTQVQDPTNADQIAKDYPNIGTPRQLYLYEYSEDEMGCGFINDYYTQQGAWHGFFCKIPSIGNNDFATMAQAVKTGDESVLSYDGKRMYDEWNSTHPNMLKTFSDIYDYWDGLMQGDGGVLKTNGYAGAATAAMTEKQAYLDKLQLETFTQIIMGTKQPEAFDEFVENWKSNGGEEITAEVNEWYQSNQ